MLLLVVNSVSWIEFFQEFSFSPKLEAITLIKRQRLGEINTVTVVYVSDLIKNFTKLTSITNRMSSFHSNP